MDDARATLASTCASGPCRWRFPAGPIAVRSGSRASLLRRRGGRALVAGARCRWTRCSRSSAARFLGKCSPVHFFWGGFDLAVTRFSGRRAPERPGADAITREGYSHEVISAGFWPGSGAVPEAAFYAYAAPEPPGFKTARVGPAAAFYSTDFGEFVLRYEDVRTAASPARCADGISANHLRCRRHACRLGPAGA